MVLPVPFDGLMCARFFIAYVDEANILGLFKRAREQLEKDTIYPINPRKAQPICHRLQRRARALHNFS